MPGQPAGGEGAGAAQAPPPPPDAATAQVPAAPAPPAAAAAAPGTAADARRLGVAPARAAGARAPLRPGEVEQVIRRALELAAADGGDVVLTLADLEDVASQVGVDRATLHRALADVRTRAAGAVDHPPAERWLGPREVTGVRRLPVDPAAVRRAAARWMEEDEGMVLAGTRDGTDRWVKDGRLLVSLRRGLQAERGEGVLRELRATTVTLEDDPHVEGVVVVVGADTAPIRNTGTGIAVTGAAASAVLGVVGAVIQPDSALWGSELLQAASVAVPGLAATAATTAAVTRTWTRKVRSAVELALDGIAMGAEDRRRPPSPPAEGWRGLALRWLGGDR